MKVKGRGKQKLLGPYLSKSQTDSYPSRFDTPEWKPLDSRDLRKIPQMTSLRYSFGVEHNQTKPNST